MLPTLTLDASLAQLRCVSLVREASELPSGYLRFETIFRYPDGTSIEVFAPTRTGQGPLRLTDLGQTTEWLLDLRLKPWLSKKRRGLVENALRTYGASQMGGELVVEVPDAAQLSEGLVRLSQACVRVADLTFTRRSSLQSAFVEEVEEVLDDSDLPYEPLAQVTGRYDKVVNVDFLVRGPRTPSLVLTLASQNISAAHARANEVFRSWYDLDIPERSEQRVTLYDDRSNAYRDDDLKRLEDLSSVVPFSDRAGLQTLLAA